MTVLRWGRCAVAVVAAAAVGAWPLHAAAAGDIDVVVASGSIGSFSQPVSVTGVETVQYAISGSCVAFADVPPDESGNCSGLGGGGTLLAAGYGTGEGSGSLTLNEPAGPVSLSYTLVLVAGLGVLATPSGWVDDGASGAAIGVLQLLPNPQTDFFPDVQGYTFTGVIVAEY